MVGPQREERDIVHKGEKRQPKDTTEARAKTTKRMSSNNAKSQRRKEKKKVQEAREISNCTFKPKINEYKSHDPRRLDAEQSQNISSSWNFFDQKTEVLYQMSKSVTRPKTGRSTLDIEYEKKYG